MVIITWIGLSARCYNGHLRNHIPHHPMIYGAFNTKTGLIEVKILDGGDSVSTEVIDIGSLKYEFDLLPDGPEVDAVQALYNKINITVFQYAHTKEDLYDRLLENVVAQSGVKVELIVDGDVFGFFIQLHDIKLSEAERTISLDCRVLYDDSASVLDVFSEIQSKEPALLRTYVQNLSDPASEELDCTGVLDWIKYAMKKMFLNDFDSVIRSVPSGLPSAFTPTNYASFATAPPANQIAFTMIRMTDPPFGGIDPDEEWDRAENPVVTYNSSTEIFTLYPFGGVEFDLTKNLRPGDNVRFYPGENFPPNWNTRVVDQILSPTTFTVTSPPSGWNTTQLWEIKKKTSTEDLTALEALQELAAIEGSIFGTAFSKNFYVNRLVEQDVVEIDWQDISNLDVSQFHNPIGITVRQLAKSINDIDGSFSNIINEGVANYGIWPAVAPWTTPDKGLPFIVDATATLAERPGIRNEVNLNVAPGYPFLSSAMWSQTDSKFYGSYDYGAFRWYQNTFPSVALCRSGVKSYVRSLSADGAGIILEFTVFGAKSIKPWNLISFTGTGLPDKYANKNFRPTSLEYDLVMDTVKVKAYQIFEEEVPDINTDPPGIPPNLSACKDELQSPVDVRLTWDSDALATSYEVQRSETSSTTGFTTIATTTQTVYHDDTPANNTTTEYWYRVRAVNQYGESDYDFAISVTFDTLTAC